MATRKFKIYRGDNENGALVDFEIEVTEGMVVLDVIHKIQADHANDLAVRWNCKAGKCGSCSMEINGLPKLSCMTRMNNPSFLYNSKFLKCTTYFSLFVNVVTSLLTLQCPKLNFCFKFLQ